MSFTEVIIEINSKDVETASSIAHMVVPYGIYIEDYSDLENEIFEITHMNLIDKDLLLKDKNIVLIHIYIPVDKNLIEIISYLKDKFLVNNIKNNISTKVCKAEDYINNWKKYFKPTLIGNKIVICPSWENFNPENKIVLRLDPGLAFGTGTHETTRLCIKLLEKYVHQGDSVLDVGCGSGILSIASLLLGAKKAVGIDIDELAVKTSIENAKMNNVSDRFECHCGNLISDMSGNFDVIVANIVSDVIIELNKTIFNYMNSKSVYIISGIIDQYKDDIINSLSDKFKILEILNENGWNAFAVKLK